MATLRLGSKVICPIKVKAPATTVLSIIPPTSQQVITPTADPFSKVLVSDVNASIDSNIIGSNICNLLLIFLSLFFNSFIISSEFCNLYNSSEISL